jgi:hypothetical protein
MLETQASGAYLIRFENGTHGFGDLCTLLSINKMVIRNFSREQIEHLLRGPIGSTIEIEFMLPDGRVKTNSLSRRAFKNEALWKCDALGITYNNYDDRNDRNWNGAFVEDSLDIEARASQNLIKRAAREYDSEPTNAIGTASLPAALTNYEVGKIDSGDADLDTCLKTYQAALGWRLTQNRQLDKSVRTLMSVHKEKEAARLLKIAREAGNNNELESAYEQLALCQLKTDKTAALATLEQFEREVIGGRYSNENPTMALIYEQAGDYKKSAEIYARIIKKTGQWSIQWTGAAQIARYKMHLAYAQNKTGERDSAIATIKDAIDKMNTLPTDQIANLERMPGISPKVSDLKSALDALQNGQEISEMKEAGAAEKQEVFPDIRECFTAIKSHDKAKALRLTNSFLGQYSGHVPNVFESSGKQNLYCSILTLAREMTNVGWINESDSVLNRLGRAAEGKDANGLAKAYLQAEVAFNASKKKNEASSEWSKLESLWHVFPKPITPTGSDQTADDKIAPEVKRAFKDIAFSTRLRILALIYYYAGELERAQLFLNRAMQEHMAERGQPSEKFVNGNADSGTQNILMLLDNLAWQQRQNISSRQNYCGSSCKGLRWLKVTRIRIRSLSFARSTETTIALAEPLRFSNKREQGRLVREVINFLTATRILISC